MSHFDSSDIISSDIFVFVMLSCFYSFLHQVYLSNSSIFLYSSTSLLLLVTSLNDLCTINTSVIPTVHSSLALKIGWLVKKGIGFYTKFWRYGLRVILVLRKE
jgi:hypothetical protein